MYKKYRINLSESELMISSRRDYYKRKGDEILATMKPESPTNVVSRLFDGNSILDASLLTGAWFPPVEADVFISHSHRDVYKTICFAGWLYEHFALRAFIDACLWEYSDDLLREMDNRHNLLDSGHYSYKGRNVSTAHAHVMLMSSLLSMMDQTECLIFIEGENALSCVEPDSEKTSSPWIYTELMASRLIKVNPPKRLKNISRSDSVYAMDESAGLEALSVEYDVSDILRGVTRLTRAELMNWQRKCSVQGPSALNVLYQG